MRNLEVIALSVKDVEELKNSEIDRIELCINIKEDGLSPSIEMVKECLDITNKNIRVMVRNKNSFNISKDDMLKEIEFVKELSKITNTYLEGIVLGYVNNDGTLNEEYLKLIEEVKGDLKVTFHKAIETLIENDEYLKLKKYKIDTLLTQGGVSNIEENINKIEEIKSNLKGIEILLGGGINKENIKEILKLNTSIHIGSLARLDKSYSKGYDFKYISEIKREML